MSDELKEWLERQRRELAELEQRKMELAEALAETSRPLEREDRRVAALRAQVQAQRDELALLERDLAELREEAARVDAAVEDARREAAFRPTSG
jgi:chromosome segregation ATPase